MSATEDPTNPLNFSGTPMVPLVLTMAARRDYAVRHRDACAELVCDDLDAGRDHTWQLNAWRKYRDVAAA